MIPIRPSATVIIPFHSNLRHLELSLLAVRRSLPDVEIVVVADGAHDDCRPLAAACDARVVEIPGPSGPASARNRGAAVAGGEVLLFVDSDVVVAPDALPGMLDYFAAHPDTSAIFGAYDEHPPEPNFMSQYRNLSHSYIHQIGARDAVTFWAGLGAVRAGAFRTVGGFDERFRRPSVEDIELGYRLTRAGYRIRLEPEFRGRHYKRWTWWGSVKIDIAARGIPWAQLLQKFQTISNDLNTRVELRLSVVLSYLLVAFLAAMVLTPWAGIGALASLVALAALNLSYYRWFARRRGFWFGVTVVPAHILHHLCNGVSFVIGTALFFAGRFGLVLPGAIPHALWTRRPASPASADPTSAIG
jgi:glycosyltransferase involved in cell wall biosynthesis